MMAKKRDQLTNFIYLIILFIIIKKWDFRVSTSSKLGLQRVELNFQKNVGPEAPQFWNKLS
jgi:hypothetical protein